MKKIGLIGGIGPESTLIYYKSIVYKANAIVGHKFFPKLTVESINVFDVFDFCNKSDFAGLTDYVMQGVNNLVASGAEIIALTGNTPHIVFEQLQAKSPVPMLSIVEVASQWAKAQGIKKPLLLGTEFTMRHKFFKDTFERNGIEILVPSESEIITIGRLISSELEHGIVKEETKGLFSELVHRMVTQNEIDCVILGCTELPLLFNEIPLPITVLDTLKVHVDELIRLSMQK